ncbi:pyridoxal-phosphate dependent enzyme [Patescibacteria group bacterium]|nr:pyridoxal-phosphate dependent enzyme [Patescibacteria group bacterium]MBU4000418.1 pyridoxal-phosphate dependent enzyme [Patescibacteria group bacterium]MBU4056385.1 pyridoxal-phosphate dependent enzyme [Patescibacteria group bacterium]MBU4368194.1 pyridoxal-phosphate dependent enzyme [Patescibacteria group bacterium]
MSTLYSKINKNLKNIWRYAVFYPPIKKENQLTLGEGNTPEVESPEIAKEFGFARLIFKREDLNPNGSHKDRLLAYQVSRAKENGEKVLIISSSGNAAISASAYCRLAGIKLFVFVSPKIDKEKLAAIAKAGSSTSFGAGATIIVSKRALTLADLAAKKFKIKNLRPGADENSYYGLKSIAFEIFESYGAIDAIFIPTSSASTLIGITEAFDDLTKLGEIKKTPEIYAVQTSKIHPIAENFDKDFVVEKESSARGIVSKNIPREKLEKILKVIKESDGGGAVVSDEEIVNAQKILEENNIITGYESATALAGAIKLREKIRGKKVVVLLTGKKWNDIMQEVAAGKNIFKADDISEVEVLFNSKIKMAM